MVRAMFAVLALGGAAAEQNVTTTTAPRDAPGNPPTLQNNGCRPDESYFTAGVARVTKCHVVCEQQYLLSLSRHYDTHPHAVDFNKGATSKHPIIDNMIGAIGHQTKLRCFGCAEHTCLATQGAVPCYTQAQIDADLENQKKAGTKPGDLTKHSHGCRYGSDSNTCAYDGAFMIGGKDGEVIVNEIMPEETCRYSYVGNTGMAGNVAEVEKLIEHLPEEIVV